MEDTQLKKVIETLLFITDHPLPVERLAQVCEVKDETRVAAALEALREDYVREGRALRVMEVAGGFQLGTDPDLGFWVRKLYHSRMTVRLSAAALETLTIIAYKQPLTRAEVEAVRGVEVIGPLETLIERKLVTVVGRKETVGRPLLYGTTDEFLRQFGLSSLDALPKLESIVADPKEVPADADVQPPLPLGGDFPLPAEKPDETDEGAEFDSPVSAGDTMRHGVPVPPAGEPAPEPELSEAVTAADGEDGEPKEGS
ncbi:MAG: segregation and condensation protein B [Elusimicrobia bacterium]|nr:MAG: segregation and condensation protein B [Elusimicrobiota bacterium]KAF0157854.1 MAG: segregation and condensation protein B [Elusimicrobiota bacterium]